MSNNRVYSVQAQGVSHNQTLVSAGTIEITVGGEAANPIQLLLASYAGCVNNIANIVAKELNFKPKNLKIGVSANLNADRYLGKSFEERAGLKVIEVELKTDNRLDEGLRLKWLKEIEVRCPVGDNLINQTPIKINLHLNNKNYVKTTSL